jgi:hypothetical protein
MRLAIRTAASLAAMLALLAPALWNGIPFLQYDTGGYLARWFEGSLAPSRSVVYGLFVAAVWQLDFWPVIALRRQSMAMRTPAAASIGVAAPV